MLEVAEVVVVVLGREGDPLSFGRWTDRTNRKRAQPSLARPAAPHPSPPLCVHARPPARLPPARLELQRRGEDGVLD